VCYSGRYLHLPFFRVSPNDQHKLVLEDPAALAAVHVPALDTQQGLLGVLLLLSDLVGVEVPELVKVGSWGSRASLRQYLQECSAAQSWDKDHFLELADRGDLPRYAYGWHLGTCDWAHMLRSIFAACPQMAHLEESVVGLVSRVMQADLSMVPAGAELLAEPLLAPYAAKARADQAAYVPQWEVNAEVAYECGLQIAQRVDWVQR
jgi:hypothetical protein